MSQCSEFWICVNHTTETTMFINRLFFNANRAPNVAGPSTSLLGHDTPVQPLLTKVMYTHLMLAMVFHNAVRIVNPEPVLFPKEKATHQATQFTKLMTSV